MKTVTLFTGTLCVSLGLLISPGFAKAQENTSDAIEALEFKTTMEDYNNLKPLQNPRYERSSKILKRRIIDRKNKAVGNVEDIIFDKRNGRVKTLYVDFDRLNLKQSVYLNYDRLDVESVSTGYRVNFEKDEIKTLYPALLSDIETASPGDINDSPVISLEKVLGSDLVSSDGKILGNVEDVLFNDKGKYVRSIYLNIDYKTIHNKGIAIPLSVLSFEEEFGKIRAVIDEIYVETILDMAKRS